MMVWQKALMLVTWSGIEVSSLDSYWATKWAVEWEVMLDCKKDLVSEE